VDFYLMRIISPHSPKHLIAHLIRYINKEDRKNSLILKEKTMKNPLMLLVLTSSLIGCNEERVHDVQYYLDHPEERKEQIGKCRNNPGELESTPNCKNALTAEAKGSFSGAKSIELPVLKIK
jgi:hypothetical protein